jgi:hypothetical protein
VNTLEQFSVRVEARAPLDSGDIFTDEAAADELMDRLEEYEGVVAAGRRSWNATATIAAFSLREAVENGMTLITSLADKCGMPKWPVVCAEAIREDVLAEQLARPSLPDLVSAPEAADILGVKLQRVHQLAAEHRDFPEPAYELRAGKLWLRAAIEAFAERKRLPGRPRRAVAAKTGRATPYTPTPR